MAELAQTQIPSIVFDYGQGFATGASPRHFIDYAKAIEIKASHEGVAINPLQLFPADIHGPVNVAQRVADTFQRVYVQIGVQQDTILRQTVLDVMSDEGIIPENRTSWDHSPRHADNLIALTASQVAAAIIEQLVAALLQQGKTQG